MKEIQEKLFALADSDYKQFHCRLMPTVNPDRVIGVRTPALRKLAKELAKQFNTDLYFADLPHDYYEENNLHGFFIEGIKDYEKCIEEIDRFLPYVDNWATCDLMSPKVFKKHLPELLDKINEWISSKETYTIRFGINMLMKYYLDDAFTEKCLVMVSTVTSEEYYVNMVIAWYFATALAKQWDAAIPYIEQKKLAPWTHNKTIQKAVESRRITDEQKAYLRTLREKI